MNILKLLVLILIIPSFSFAAEIQKATKNSVIVSFDPLEENYVTGDRLIASQDGQKKALLEISKVKGNRFLARILYGKAAAGMSIQKFGMVTDTKPSSSAPNMESVTIRFASMYVYRGIPQGIPYIAGALDYLNEGILAGIAIANAVRPATSEFDSYLGFALNRLNWTLTPMVAAYLAPGFRKGDTYDFMLNFTYRVVSIDISYIPKYFGAHSSDLYYKFSTSLGLSERWRFNAYVGNSAFSNEAEVGHRNYLDYRTGFLYSTPEFAVEFAWTDTFRKNLSGANYDDGTAAVLISKRF